MKTIGPPPYADRFPFVLLFRFQILLTLLQKQFTLTDSVFHRMPVFLFLSDERHLIKNHLKLHIFLSSRKMQKNVQPQTSWTFCL